MLNIVSLDQYEILKKQRYSRVFLPTKWPYLHLYSFFSSNPIQYSRIKESIKYYDNLQFTGSSGNGYHTIPTVPKEFIRTKVVLINTNVREQLVLYNELVNMARIYNNNCMSIVSYNS